MRIDDVVESISLDARRTWESCVERDAPLCPIVGCFRGDGPVATVAVGNGTRAAVLAVAHYCAVGFASDVIAIVGGMAPSEAALPAEYPAALLVVVVNRAGDVVREALPYRVTGQVVAWGDPVRVSDPPYGDESGGALTRALRTMMNRPVIGTIPSYREMSAERGVEEAQAAADLACARVLLEPPAALVAKGMSRHNVVALSYSPGSRRAEMIHERFATEDL